METLVQEKTLYTTLIAKYISPSFNYTLVAFSGNHAQDSSALPARVRFSYRRNQALPKAGAGNMVVSRCLWLQI